MSLETCTCNMRVMACEQNPGFMIPEEAEAAIAAGQAKNLMCEWIDSPDIDYEAKDRGFKDRIWMLVPASLGYGGKEAPLMPEYESMAESFLARFTNPWRRGQCVFLKEKRCSIHDSGFKPKQCRETLACAIKNSPGPDNYDIAEFWNNDKAQKLVIEWKELVGCN